MHVCFGLEVPENYEKTKKAGYSWWAPWDWDNLVGAAAEDFSTRAKSVEQLTIYQDAWDSSAGRWKRVAEDKKTPDKTPVPGTCGLDHLGASWQGKTLLTMGSTVAAVPFKLHEWVAGDERSEPPGERRTIHWPPQRPPV